MIHPEFRSAHNYDWKAASDECSSVNSEPSLARQEFAEECDINTIVRNFGVTGDVPQVRAPMYGDFSNVSDYRSAIHAVREAEDSFMQMDAHVRARFENDPQLFLEFCSDPANADEARELGLIFEEVEDVPVSGAVVAGPVAVGGAGGSDVVKAVAAAGSPK